VSDALTSRLGSSAAASILKDSVAAVSVGLVNGLAVLDLNYPEDSRAEVDLNVVRLGGGGLVEVQGTGESGTFSRSQLQTLLDLAEAGLDELRALQQAAVRAAAPGSTIPPGSA
jgi:ribonuclease PH